LLARQLDDWWYQGRFYFGNVKVRRRRRKSFLRGNAYLLPPSSHQGD
jgi:hypothetical protein